MGRRKKTKIGYFDRLGERIPLNKCPRCSDYPDCFANIDGICTALKCCSQGCSFYKEKESAMQEIRANYRKLRAEKKFDLLEKYHNTFYALGVVEDELSERMIALVNMSGDPQKGECHGQ